MVWAFVTIGVVLRLRQYQFDRSLWNDETELVMNILHRSPAALLKPLNRFQVAPIGFLWLEKISVHFLGSGEMALRLVPIFCGVGSLFLFLAVARRFVRGSAVPIAVGMFAISNPLIYYASEVKQYSSDVAVALLVYLVMDALFDAKLRVATLVFAAVVGSLAIWFSFPAAFVLAGIGLAAVWAAGRQHSRSSVLLLSVVGLVWSTSFLLFYVVSLHGTTNNHALIEYWRAAYAPLPPTSVSDVLWYESTFFNIFSFPAGLALTGIAAVAAVLGANEFRRRDQGRFLSQLLPIAVVLLASALHRYPFQGRFILFLVPSIFLLVAEGLEVVRRTTGDTSRVLAVLLIGFLFLEPSLTAARHFVRPPGVEEVRSAIDYIERYRAQGDILYCYYSAEFPLEYYRERGRIGLIEQITGVASRDNLQPYRDDLDKLRGEKRVWILFSHDWQTSGVDEQAYFLDHLGQIGTRLDGMQATGAAAYLYDLSGDGAARR